ncbi:hypothetical protein BDZ45DRAFT_690315 [Acephala macrosclerotiorum]|nr:hypothetical protein BDZ45DRAFT_690315 [Acephala macrosclerotiorum]
MCRSISEEVHRSKALEALMSTLHLNIPAQPFENEEEENILVSLEQVYFALNDSSLSDNLPDEPGPIFRQFNGLFNAVGLLDRESEDLTLLIFPAYFVRDTANFLESLSLMDLARVTDVLTQLAASFGWEDPETKLDLALERLLWTIRTAMEAIFPSLDT